MSGFFFLGCIAEGIKELEIGRRSFARLLMKKRAVAIEINYLLAHSANLGGLIYHLHSYASQLKQQIGVQDMPTY
jgi:hypothetical protein